MVILHYFSDTSSSYSSDNQLYQGVSVSHYVYFFNFDFKLHSLIIHRLVMYRIRLAKELIPIHTEIVTVRVA